MKRKKLLILAAAFSVILVLSAVAAALIIMIGRKESKNDSNQSGEAGNAVTSIANYKFADYKPVKSTVTPNVKTYTVASNLSNVSYTKKTDSKFAQYAVIDKALSTTQKTALAKDNFIITTDSAKYKEFFSLYEGNRYSYVPSFVTTDSVLHTYHLIFDSTLKDLESNYLAAQTLSLTKQMVTKSQEQYDAATTDSMKTAAKRNIAYFSVAVKVQDPNFAVPALVKSEVDTEVSRINAHSETHTMSVVMAIGYPAPTDVDNVMEDYTQYIPRGHYTKSDTLKNYFKSMMWMGRMTFLVKDRTNSDSSFLITDVLRQDNSVKTKWDNIFAPITFFVGKSDDLGYNEYKAILDDKLPNTKVVAASEDQLNTLWTEAKKLEPPKLNSIPIYDAAKQPDKDAATKGFRFFGQRFTMDANIFQNLIYRDLKEKSNGDKKMLPSFIEIPASMGDATATSIIKADTDYYTFPTYESQVAKLKATTSAMTQAEWTWNLYSSWLYTLNAQIGPTPAGYPQFMLTEKWNKKELNTYAGSWTELKHDTILYSKQVYAELGAGEPPTSVPDDKGYVEPNVELYSRLAALVDMTKSGLESRGIITAYKGSAGCSTISDYKQKTDCNLIDMKTAVGKLSAISDKELQEKALSADEYNFIRYFGGSLEAMFMATLDPGSDNASALDKNPAMLVADVATDPNGFALEEGTGYVNDIYVIVPVEGKLRIAKGGVYSQYEFVNSSKNRLTDEAWRTMLSKGTVPAMMKWQSSLITK